MRRPRPSTLYRREVGAGDDRTPKEDLVLKLFDFRFELEGNLHKECTSSESNPRPAMHEWTSSVSTGPDLPNLNAGELQGHGPAPADAVGGALDSHDAAGWCAAKRSSPRALRAAL